MTMGELATSFLQNMSRDLQLVNQDIQDFSFVKGFLRTSYSESPCAQIPHTVLFLKWPWELPWVRLAFSLPFPNNVALDLAHLCKEGVNHVFDQRKLTHSFIPKVTLDTLFWIVICHTFYPQAFPYDFELAPMYIYQIMEIQAFHLLPCWLGKYVAPLGFEVPGPRCRIIDCMLCYVLQSNH